MSSSTDELFPRCPDCGSHMTDTDRGSECMANVYNMGGCSTYAELNRLRPLVAEVEKLTTRVKELEQELVHAKRERPTIADVNQRRYM